MSFNFSNIGAFLPRPKQRNGMQMNDPTSPDISMNPYAPPTNQVWSENPSDSLDPTRDVLIPQLRDVEERLASAYDPPKIGFGRQLASALVGRINPGIGGLITGDAQRQRQIQGLTGQEEVLGNIIKLNQAQRMNDLTAQNINSEIQDRGAQAQYRQKQLELLGQPKPPGEEKIGTTVDTGEGLYQWNPDSQRYDIKVGPGKQKNATAQEQSVSDFLAASNLPDTPVNRDRARQTLATRNREPKQPSEQDKAIGDYLQANNLPDTPANRTNARQQLKITDRPPNQQEITRSEMANNLNENLDQLEDVLNRRGNDLFGPIAGRITQLREWKGSNDPDIGTLAAISDMMGRAQTSAHGMRNGQLVERAAQSILNSYKNGPDAIRAAIKAARSSVKTFQEDVGATPVPKANNDPLGIR